LIPLHVYSNFMYLNFIIMDRRLLSLLTAIRNRRIIIILLLLEAIIVGMALLGVGGKHSGWFFGSGIALSFYIFLHPWEFKTRYYYGTLMGISIILPLLAFYVIDIRRLGEDFVWLFIFICIAAFFAGLIGLVLPSDD
jgi:hypothetical protein